MLGQSVLVVLMLSLMLMGGVSLSLTISEDSVFTLSFEVSESVGGFVMLVVFVSTFISVYSKYYMASEFNMNYYLFLMLLFTLSMVILLVADSLLVLVIGWEFLGISSFFLINYYQTWEGYNNSMVTLMTMRVGEVFLFMVLSSLFMVSHEISSHVFYVGGGLSLIVVSMTKSAQIPFSGWLPKAMSAPTPTSALVHSSTLVTAGLVVIMVYSDALMSSMGLCIMMVVGFITMVSGSFLALFEMSIKRVVAYSTLSQMGLGMMVYGLGSFHYGLMNLISHGFAKSLLFMQVGYLMHTAGGQQNIRAWQSVGSVEGFMKVQLICSLLSLSGTTFFSGMLSKELLLGLMVTNSLYLIIFLLMILCIFMTLLYSVMIYKSLFNSSGSTVICYYSSVSMLISTCVSVTLVICHFSWMINNIFIVMKVYTMSDMIGLVVVMLTSLSMFMFFSESKVATLSQSLCSVLSSIQHYVWIKSLVRVEIIEALFVSLNNYIWISSLVLSRKLSFISSMSGMAVLLIMMLMLIL